MIKKFMVLAFAVGMLLLMQNSHAIGWGQVTVSSSETTTWVDKFSQTSIPMTIEYVPYFFGALPAKVDISVTGTDWLTVIPSQPSFVLSPNTPKTVDLIIAPSKFDVQAGRQAKIIVSVSGQLVTGGLFRTLDETRLEILVGFNPYTQISVSSVQPISRTSPDKELPFIVDIYNYGNTRVEVDLAFVEEPGDWQKIISPSKIFIEAKPEDDTSFPHETVTITITSPHGTAVSYHNDWQSFSVKAKARSFTPYFVRRAGDWEPQTEENPGFNSAEATAFFLAKNRGFYIPGFDAMLLIAGLALAGLLIYKKKK